MLAESPMRPSTPKASAASLPPPLLRLLPGGTNQFPDGISLPLRTNAFSRRTRLCIQTNQELAKGCCKTPILQIRWVDQKFPGKRWLDGCVELPALNRNSPRLDRLRWPMGLLGLVDQYCPPSTYRRGPEM